LILLSARKDARHRAKPCDRETDATGMRDFADWNVR
jgi:hypothetical protein